MLLFYCPTSSAGQSARLLIWMSWVRIPRRALFKHTTFVLALVSSASLRCLWVAARHRVRRCTGSTPPSSLPGGCTDCASFRASQSARWRKRLWLPPKTARHSRQPPSPPSSPQMHHHRICHRRRRRRQKLLVLDTVVMRRCRVRLCVPRGGARHRARGCTQVRCRRRMCCAGSGRWMRISSSTAAAAGGAR